MEIRQLNTLKAFERVQEYCATHPIESPPPGYTALVATLGEILNRLRGYTVEQHAETQAALGETRRQVALADRVRRKHLIPVRRIALAWLGDVPEIEARFQVPLPKSGRRSVAVALRAMAVNAATYSELLIAQGRPADFIAQLTAAADELERGVAEQATKGGARSAATEGIKEEIRRIMQVVRRIDAILRNAHSEDSVALAGWRAARRVAAVTGPRRRRSGEPVPESAGEVKTTA